MNLPPTILASLITDEPRARAIADGMSELFEPEEVATAAFELASIEAAIDPTKKRPTPREGAMGTLSPGIGEEWRVELHFAFEPDEDDIRALVAGFGGAEAGEALEFSRIEAKDWVAASLEGLKPVEAGRFLIHGAHDREKVPANRIGIEIEAALAFGTGHHGTTRGCLLHFDALLKRHRVGKPLRIADIGAGTGVLAIGAAKALKTLVMAGEIDPDSVEIAIANARLNRVSNYLRPVVAAGLNHEALRGARRYDLIFANILARPLRRLAPDIARASAANGTLILSGLLPQDVAGVLSAYGTQGFHLRARQQIEGWVSLTLKR